MEGLKKSDAVGKKKKYEQFEANRQVVSFAKEIGKGLIEALRNGHKL